MKAYKCVGGGPLDGEILSGKNKKYLYMSGYKIIDGFALVHIYELDGNYFVYDGLRKYKSKAKSE